MPTEIYLVADDLPGGLFIMPCPSGNHLSRDIGAYQARGIDTLVTMLTEAEVAQLGLADEAAACDRTGIKYISSPIRDYGLPDPAVFDALIDQIAAMLRGGQLVAVHCRAGIGRSGMVSAATLVALGMDAQKAIEQVAQARGVSIPDTVEQGKFIVDYQARRCKDSM